MAGYNTVIEGLEHCGFTKKRGCNNCPYNEERKDFGIEACVGSLTTDALKILQGYNINLSTSEEEDEDKRLIIKKVIKISEKFTEKELEICKITLLSDVEYRKYYGLFPSVYESWWLRSSNEQKQGVPVVTNTGCIAYSCTDNENHYVRPVLKIRNLKSSGFNVCDKFNAAALTWTVIGDELALCDKTIAQSVFCKYWWMPDANHYRTSHIKDWLTEWGIRNGLIRCLPEEIYDIKPCDNWDD